MTWSQYASAAGNMVARQMGVDWPEYRPDYTDCINHFAIHAGWAASSSAKVLVFVCIIHPHTASVKKHVHVV
jgi:hypothetical protein